MQSAVRMFSESYSTYEELINNFFFLIYLSIGVYISLSLIYITSDWYISWIRQHNLEEIDLGKIRHNLEEIDVKEIDQRTTRSIQYIFQLIFIFFVIIVLLAHFGITTATFHEAITALGFGSIIIGLAARNALSDLIAGIAISIDRPFRIGDRIQIEKLDMWGYVRDVTWRSTRILTDDNRQVAISNSVISKELIMNYSLSDSMFRVETFIIVYYVQDVDHVRNLILESLAHEDWIIHDRPIQALFSGFTEFETQFKVRC